MDYIEIDKLKIFCNHGVYDEEKANGQNFYVSARLYTDTAKAACNDDLNFSVNYAEACHKITAFLKNNNFDLIETVANRLCDYLLAEYEIIRAIELTIHKPEAPIGLPFSDVSVTIKRHWEIAYIALGGNIGDSEAILNDACQKIVQNPHIRLKKRSSFIVTAPYGEVEQDDFLNGCIEIETYYSPYELLDYLHLVEKEAHRERLVHWGPRTLDLDIILFGDEIINTETLVIPHKDMQNRDFVLKPLCEIAPYAYNPRLRMSAEEMLNNLRGHNNEK